MSFAFCTISTASHLPQVYALFASLQKFDEDVKLNVLITDKQEIPNQKHSGKINFFFLNDLKNYSETNSIAEKYRNAPDSLRWSMKPVFLKFLLEQGNGRVIYTDNDIYFFNDYHFLFSLLEENSIILTPHWRNTNPSIDPESFETNFKDGVFNGGFVGVNKNAVAALDWWAKCCAYKCEVNFERGLFVDQKYLDLFPVLFDGVHIIKHKGCNVAYWNQIECKRTLSNGEVLINNQYSIIFIHFTGYLINDIASGKDSLLKQHLTQYETDLKKQAG